MEIDPRTRLRHIRCFLAIARAGTLSEAAESLHITQPAASKTLKELEAILGVELFDRAARRLRLNAAGQLFQQHAGNAFAELMRAQDEVRKVRRDTVKLSVGVLPSAATDLFPRAALEFRRRQPHAIVHVMTGPNWLMLSQLREGNIDMVVGRMAQPAQMSGLGFEQLYLEDVVLVARPGHPLALRKRPAAEIGDWPLVLPPGGALIFPVVSGYLQSLGLRDLQPVFETVSHAFGSRVVRLSDAIWFISRGVVSEDLAAGRLVEIPLRSPMLTGPVGISLSDRRPQNLERDELVRVLREIAGDQGQSANREMLAR